MNQYYWISVHEDLGVNRVPNEIFMGVKKILNFFEDLLKLP